MTVEQAMKKAENLLKRSKLAILGTIGRDGYPNNKALLNRRPDSLKVCWFTTNTSSKRVARLREDPRACLYYMDAAHYKGLLLIGHIEILQDADSRRLIWQPGDEMFYPLGVNDPDYTVLKFTGEWGNYYEGLANVDFNL